MLNKIVTPGCYNQPPLKRISSRDSKQEPEERKRDYNSWIGGYTKDYTTSNDKPHGELGIHGLEQLETTEI